ncbi:MAG: CBS domain-containing protein [Arhodomonas sp.]|nr:CBS domain-containing protein [Arhodomonas sp.]
MAAAAGPGGARRGPYRGPPPRSRDRLIEATRSSELAEAVSHLELDELADLYDKLPRKVVRALIRTMDLQRRQRLRRVLSYPEDTAGGLTDADALAVREDITLETAQRYLRRVRKKEGALPEHRTALFVIDRENRFRGLLPLDELVAQPQSALVGETMDHEFRAIPADTAARQVARLFEDRDLTTAPVVDPEGRLIGRITVDDVVDVIRDEGERSLMQSAGLNRNEDMFAPVLATAARRGVWLGANLVNAFIASWVIGLFGATIEERVALAILMPIVASMGGVAGIQTLTLVVRGIALDQIGRANGLRLLGHEFRVALVLGLALALILGAAALVWFRDPDPGAGVRRGGGDQPGQRRVLGHAAAARPRARRHRPGPGRRDAAHRAHRYPRVRELPRSGGVAPGLNKREGGMGQHEGDASRLDVARRFFETIPHSAVLGMEPVAVGEGCLTARVPYRPELVGNPVTGVIHGGVITTLVDQTSGGAVIAALDRPRRWRRWTAHRLHAPRRARRGGLCPCRVLQGHQPDCLRPLHRVSAGFPRSHRHEHEYLHARRRGRTQPDRGGRMNDLMDRIAAARAAGDPDALVALIPYARLLGIAFRDDGGELSFRLGFQEGNVGNPHLPALHGGVIGAFMENAAALHLLWREEAGRVPKVVDFSIDYLRRPAERYGRAAMSGARAAGWPTSVSGPGRSPTARSARWPPARCQFPALRPDRWACMAFVARASGADDAVASPTLGGIEGLVQATQGALQWLAGAESAHPEADAHGDALAVDGLHILSGHSAAQPLAPPPPPRRHPRAAVSPGILAAIAGHQVAARAARAQHRRYMLEHPVATVMAVLMLMRLKRSISSMISENGRPRPGPTAALRVRAEHHGG